MSENGSTSDLPPDIEELKKDFTTIKKSQSGHDTSLPKHFLPLNYKSVLIGLSTIYIFSILLTIFVLHPKYYKYEVDETNEEKLSIRKLCVTSLIVSIFLIGFFMVGRFVTKKYFGI